MKLSQDVISMLKHTGYIDGVYFECDSDYTKDGTYVVRCYCPDRYKTIKTINGISEFLDGDDWGWSEVFLNFEPIMLTSYVAPVSSSPKDSLIDTWSTQPRQYSFQDEFTCVNIAVEELCK